MAHRKNIEHIIASVVTTLALTVPVTYIQSIVFFKNRKRILYCKWNNEQLHYSWEYNSPENEAIGSELINLVVCAIDSNGQPVRFLAPYNQTAFE